VHFRAAPEGIGYVLPVEDENIHTHKYTNNQNENALPVFFYSVHPLLP